MPDPNDTNPRVPEESIAYARFFLLDYGFTEETLAEMSDAEIMHEMIHRYQEIQGALRGSIPLIVTPTLMLYLTPFRWGWKDIDMTTWRLLHKGPFYMIRVFLDRG